MRPTLPASASGLFAACVIWHVDSARQAHDAVDIVALVAAEQPFELRLYRLASSARAKSPFTGIGAASFQKP